MKKQGVKKLLSSTLAFLSILVLFNSCDSWMNADAFISDLDEEVRVANAKQINVYFRFATTKEGTTTPNGYETLKVDVAYDISCITESDYGFYKWAAFTTDEDNGFAVNGQHKTLLYANDTSYEQFKKKELGSDVVEFADPKSPETSVTIHSERNDIFIIPIVAERPVISDPYPSDGAVRNTPIRITFSKAMDESTLISNGLLSDNITISTAETDSDGNVNLTDITEKFTNVSLSSSKKTLAIRLPSGEYLERNTRIRVSLSSEIKDIYGYTMADSDSFTFKTGTGVDQLAPVIKTLVAGLTKAEGWGSNQSSYSTDSSHNAFEDYLAVPSTSDEMVGKYSYISSGTTSEILKQRSNGSTPVRILVYANDITTTSTSGSSSDSDSDVDMVYIKASQVVAAGTNPENAVTTIASQSYKYNPGGCASGSRTADVTSGYEIPYDISSLPDGLIKIDVGVSDVIGNSSFDTACVSQDSQNYFKTIYVVLDRTAPDAVSNISNVSVSGFNANNWFNASTITSLKLSQPSVYTIKDANDQNLASKPANLKWTFSLDNGESWKEWKDANYAYSITDAASSASEGAITIQMKLKDDLGNESPAVSLAPIYMDTVKPQTSAINWKAASGTSGIATGTVLTDQTLEIPFTEVTSGLYKIQIDVTAPDNTVYASPFSAVAPDGGSALSVTDSAGNALAYTASGKVMTLTSALNSETSGTIKITGLKIADSTQEGTYSVKITLTDYAENTDSGTTISIANDSTKPVVNKITLNDVVKSEDLNSKTRYFLGFSNYNNESNHDPDTVGAEITLTEANSGVKTIYFTGNFIPQETTKLALNGTAISSEAYTIDTENKTITFVTSPAEGTPVLKSASQMVLGLTNLKAENFNTPNTDSANVNTFAVKLTDFALNESDELNKITFNDTTLSSVQGTKAAVGFNIFNELTDAGFESGKNIIPSEAGYTNEKYVNIAVLNQSIIYSAAAPVSKLILTGAKFVSDVSEVYYNKNGWVSFPNTTIGTTNTENDTLIFNTNYAFVSSTAFGIRLLKVCLSDETQGEHTVSVQAVQCNGMTVDAVSKVIIYDSEAPSFENDCGPYVSASSNYTARNDQTQYVYPHANGTNGYGFEYDSSDKNSDGKTVRYFYTRTGRGTETNGVLSKYGVTLTIPARDNLRLKYTSGTPRTCAYWYAHTGSETDSIDANYIININTDTDKQVPESWLLDETVTSSSTSQNLTFNFDSNDSTNGTKYSVVVADAAGNVSPVYTFVVVQDDKAPSLTVDGEDYSEQTSLTNLMTILPPDSSESPYRVVQASETTHDFTGLYSGEITASKTAKALIDFVIRKSETPYKIVVKLGTGTTTSDLALDGDSISTATVSYCEKSTTKLQSGLAAYAFVQLYDKFSCDKPGYTASTPENAGVAWQPYDASVNDGNISVDIPTDTEYVRPFALWLKDNCGNTSQILVRTPGIENNDKANAGKVPYIYNTEYSWAETTTHVSWLIDSKLGSATTDAATGRTTTRSTALNPGASLTTEENGYPCTILGADYYMVWGNQAGSNRNGSGVNTIGKLARDNVKKCTYYNNNATFAVSVEEETNFVFSSSTIDSTTEKPENWEQFYEVPEDQDLGTDYTCRGKLYWTKDPDPSYSTIVNASSYQSTAWKYVQSGGRRSTFVFNYPQVDYTALGWNNTEPYYIYYLVEDRVGNYEINTVVNDAADQYNKWLYDNTAPVITLADGTALSDITSDQSGVTALIPPNNGYRAYWDGSKVLVAWNESNTNRNPEALVSTEDNRANGVSRHVINANREYINFFNLKVGEQTGIRAFRYYSSEDRLSDEVLKSGKTQSSASEVLVPLDYTSIKYDTNTGGDNDWFGGYGITSYDTEIGSTYTNSNYNTYNSYNNTEYKNTYSGTTLIEVTPYAIKEKSVYVYLYVMDWVGNISSYRVGDFPIKTDESLTSCNNELAVDNHTDNYYLNMAATSTGGSLTIAGLSDDVKNGNKIKVYMPALKYYGNTTSDNSDTTPAYGWALNNSARDVTKVLIETEESTGHKGESYVLLDPADYKDYTSTAKAEVFAVYDEVGNANPVTFNISYDETAPALTVYGRARKEGATALVDYQTSIESFSQYDYTGDGVRTRQLTGTISDNTSFAADTLPSEENFAKVMVSTACKYFQFDPACGSSMGDVYNSRIYNWNGTAWELKADYRNDASGTWYEGHFGSTGEIDSNSNQYKLTSPLLAFDSEKPYYAVSLIDNTGNANYAYIKIEIDNVPPYFVTGPKAVPATGSLNEYNGKYYYNKLNETFSAKDDGVGLYNFLFNETGTGWTSGIGYLNNGASGPVKVESEKEYTVPVGGSSSSAPTAIILYDAVDNGNSSTAASQEIEITVGGVTKKVAAGNFVNDATAPVFSTTDTSSVSATKYYSQWYSPAVTCYEKSFDSTNNAYTVSVTEASSYKLNFTFTLPSVTEAVGVMGYLVKETALTTEEIAASHIYSSDVQTENTIKVSGSSSGTNCDFTLSTSAASYTRYIYAVDYAGNLSSPVTLTFKYVSDSVPQKETGFVVAAGNQTAIYQKEESGVKTNWFKNLTLTVPFAIKSPADKYYPSSYMLKAGDKEGTVAFASKLSSGYSGSGPYTNSASITLSSDTNVTVTTVSGESASTETKTLSDFLSSGGDLSFYLTNYYGNSEPYSVTYSDVSLWKLDSTAPVVQNLSYSTSTDGAYLKGNATDGYTLYYKSGIEKVVISVSADVTEEGSGLKGYGTTFEGASETLTLYANLELQGSWYEPCAYDKVGNVSSALAKITPVEVSTVPKSPSAFDFLDKDGNTISNVSDYYYENENGKYYFNSTKIAKIKFRGASALDSNKVDILAGYYEGSASTDVKSDGIFDISAITSETTFNIYATDLVGNSSSAYSITLIPDSTSPSGNYSVASYTNSGDGYYLSGTNLYYNAKESGGEKVKTDLTISGISDSGAGLKGFSTSASSVTGTATTVTLSSADFTDNGTVTIYAIDNVGNSYELCTLTTILKNTAPSSSTGDYNAAYTAGSGTAKGFASGTGFEIVADSGSPYTVYGYYESGKTDYETFMYTKGTKVTLPLTTALGNVKYFFTTGTSQSDEGTYGDLTAVTDGKLTVTLPSVADLYSFIWIHLKDEVGNESVYNIGNPSGPGCNWMMEYSANTAATYSTSATTYSWDNGSFQSTVTVTIGSALSTAPLKSIKLNVPSVDNVTWYYGSTTFYNSDSTKSYSDTNGTGATPTDNVLTISFNSDSSKARLPLGGDIKVTLYAKASDYSLQNGPTGVTLASLTDVAAQELSGENITARSVVSRSFLNSVSAAAKKVASFVTGSAKKSASATPETTTLSTRTGKTSGKAKKSNSSALKGSSAYETGTAKGASGFTSVDVEKELEQSLNAASKIAGNSGLKADKKSEIAGLASDAASEASAELSLETTGAVSNEVSLINDTNANEMISEEVSSSVPVVVFVTLLLIASGILAIIVVRRKNR